MIHALFLITAGVILADVTKNVARTVIKKGKKGFKLVARVILAKLAD